MNLSTGGNGCSGRGLNKHQTVVHKYVDEDAESGTYVYDF